MPALAMHSSVSSRLLECLEDRLHNDYGFLLSLLPRNLFYTDKGKIQLQRHYLRPQYFDKDPTYGSLSGEFSSQYLNTKSPPGDSDSDRFALKSSTIDREPSDLSSLSSLEDRLVGFTQVPPLRWHFKLPPSLHHLETSEWSKRTSALIQYYLLIWASEEGFSGWMPGPNLEHLRDAFDQLKGTDYYEMAMIRRQGSDFFDIHIPQVTDKNIRAAQKILRTDHIRSDSTERSSSPNLVEGLHTTSKMHGNRSSITMEDILRDSSYPPSSSEAGPSVDATNEPIKFQHDTYERSTTAQSFPDSNFPSSTEQSTQSQQSDTGSRAESFTTVESTPLHALEGHQKELIDASTAPKASSEATSISEAASYDFPKTAQGHETEPQPLPNLNGADLSTSTVDTPAQAVANSSPNSPSGAKPPVVDEQLAHLQEMVGNDLLSLLPDLATTMFKTLHARQERPGYLSIRMLFGKGKESAPAQLRGRNVWIVYKIHEKDARTAPRMLLDALTSDDNEVIEENLNFKSTLPWLDLETVFKVVTEEGLKREHQLKAIVKYYFILAANAKLHGFNRHLMPANDTFVEQMRTVCRRIQNNDAAPRPRKRRRIGTPQQTGASTPSIVDYDSSSTPPPAGRRSGRSLKRPLSSVENGAAEHQDYSRPSTPKKVALGALIRKNAPSHMKNHFLDVDMEACDSDGDSGDEIPAGVPAQWHDILLRRAEARRMVQSHAFWTRDHREKKNGHTKAARKFEWLVSHAKETLDAVKGRIDTEKRLASKWQDRIEDRQAAISGFKKKDKEYDALIQSFDRSVVRLWDAQQKQSEEREMQEQQALDGLQKSQ